MATLIVLAVIASAFAAYEFVHLNNANVVTVTDTVVTSYTDNYNVIVSGTCTGMGGTVSVNSTTTTYIETYTGMVSYTAVTVHSNTTISTTRTITLNSTTSTNRCPTYV